MLPLAAPVRLFIARAFTRTRVYFGRFPLRGSGCISRPLAIAPCWRACEPGRGGLWLSEIYDAKSRETLSFLPSFPSLFFSLFISFHRHHRRLGVSCELCRFKSWCNSRWAESGQKPGSCESLNRYKSRVFRKRPRFERLENDGERRRRPHVLRVAIYLESRGGITDI